MLSASVECIMVEDMLIEEKKKSNLSSDHSPGVPGSSGGQVKDLMFNKFHSTHTKLFSDHLYFVLLLLMNRYTFNTFKGYYAKPILHNIIDGHLFFKYYLVNSRINHILFNFKYGICCTDLTDFITTKFCIHHY